jgi:hypothetical protein
MPKSEETNLINLLLLTFEILPSRFKAPGLIECGLGFCPQIVQLVLERKIIL